MSTRLMLFLTMLTVSFVSCEQDDDTVWPQLLNNSDLESGSNQPAAWISDEVAGDLILEWTDAESFSPSRSLRMANVSSDTAVWGYWVQSYGKDIPYGKDLLLSVKIKGENLQGQGVAIAIRADREGEPVTNSQFATTQDVQKIDGTFDWTTYTVRLNAIEPDVRAMHVYLVYASQTSGEAYFDDPTLTVE